MTGTLIRAGHEVTAGTAPPSAPRHCGRTVHGSADRLWRRRGRCRRRAAHALRRGRGLDRVARRRRTGSAGRGLAAGVDDRVSRRRGASSSVPTGAGIALLEVMMLGTKAPAEHGAPDHLVSGPEALADAGRARSSTPSLARSSGSGRRSGRLRPSSWPPTPGSASITARRRSRSRSPGAWASTRSCSSTRSPTLRSTAATPT